MSKSEELPVYKCADGGKWHEPCASCPHPHVCLEGKITTYNPIRPSHYGGPDAPHEVIKCLEAWGLDYDAYLFQTVCYIARAGRKSDNKVEDLKKARFYLDRRIQQMEKENYERV